jgi:hypothetical protein
LMSAEVISRPFWAETCCVVWARPIDENAIRATRIERLAALMDLLPAVAGGSYVSEPNKLPPGPNCGEAAVGACHPDLFDLAQDDKRKARMT